MQCLHVFPFCSILIVMTSEHDIIKDRRRARGAVTNETGRFDLARDEEQVPSVPAEIADAIVAVEVL